MRLLQLSQQGVRPRLLRRFLSLVGGGQGEDRRMPSNDAIGKAIVALGDKRVGHGTNDFRDSKRRYYLGIFLNENGKKYWQRALAEPAFHGKTTSTTPSGYEVNTVIPESWLLERPAVRAFIAANEARDRTAVHRAASVTQVSPVMTGQASPEPGSVGDLSFDQPPEGTEEPLF